MIDRLSDGQGGCWSTRGSAVSFLFQGGGLEELPGRWRLQGTVLSVAQVREGSWVTRIGAVIKAIVEDAFMRERKQRWGRRGLVLRAKESPLAMAG